MNPDLHDFELQKTISSKFLVAEDTLELQMSVHLSVHHQNPIYWP